MMSSDYAHRIQNLDFIIFYFFKFYLFIFRESGKEGEREGEKHQCVVAFHLPPTGDPAHNPGMCPDWESNQRPFGSQTGTQSTEPHQPGQTLQFFKKCYADIAIHVFWCTWKALCVC